MMQQGVVNRDEKGTRREAKSSEKLGGLHSRKEVWKYINQMYSFAFIEIRAGGRTRGSLGRS